MTATPLRKPNVCNGVRPSSPAVAISPAGLHFSLLGDFECVVDLDSEVSHSAFKFAVTK